MDQRHIEVILKRLISSLFVLCVATHGANSWATNPVWSSKTFSYRAEGKKLAEVIQDFAALQRVPLVVDPGVEGTLNAEFDTTPVKFMDTLEKTYGLVWYFDGVTLFVYPSKLMQSKLYQLRGYGRDQLKQMLESLGLGDSRYPLRYNDQAQTLLAYGPPRHIELVSTMVESLNERFNVPSSLETKVIRLKHAFASDRSSGNSKVQGMASLLNALFGGGGGGDSGAAKGAPMASAMSAMSAMSNPRMASMSKLSAVAPVSGGRPGAEAARPDASGQPGDMVQRPAPEQSSTKPFFQADEGTNSVIMRGKADQFESYESLIRLLDIPQEMVEIEATILDISVDESKSLGFQWNYTNGGNSVSVVPGDSASGSAFSGNFTTVLDNGSATLLKSTVRALEANGKARIVSMPKILTAANRVASMTDKRVASVRVSGNLEANLYSVEAGTSLEIQPQIVPLGDVRGVRLTIHITDGTFQATSVDQIPIVKSTEIQTEATITEGKSLLIGGITYESNIESFSGVLGLNKLPLVGSLFSFRSTATVKTERLFLLTPRLLAAAKPALAEQKK